MNPRENRTAPSKSEPAKFVKFTRSGGREIWIAIDDISTIEPSETYQGYTAAITFRGDAKTVMYLNDKYVDVVNAVVRGIKKKATP